MKIAATKADIERSEKDAINATAGAMLKLDHVRNAFKQEFER